jgi:hypothetical protein
MRLLQSRFKTIFFLIFLALVAAPVILIGLGLESYPLVTPTQGLSLRDVDRIKYLLKRNDPRNLRAGEIKTLSISERDLNLLVSYSLSHMNRLDTRIDLHPGSLSAHLTVSLPENPIGSYLNVSVLLSQVSDSLRVEDVQIGRLMMPAWLVNSLLQYLHRFLLRYEEYHDVIKTVNGFRLTENKLLVVYQWQPALARQIRTKGHNLLFSDQDKARLLAYADLLSQLSHTRHGRTAPLTEFLQPMFSLASKRTAAGHDPKKENRTLIMVLAMYISGADVSKFLSTCAEENCMQPRRLSLTLFDRWDLVQHFVISAAITVSSSGGLADALGLFKELDDSKGGSGFSFADLASDRAGVRFAEMSIASREQARVLQARMSEKLSETDFMPRIDHLPEAIMELEFKRHYGDVDSPAYRLLDREIERRVAACSVYR